LSGGHFRYKAGWFLNAFLSASIIITIPTLVSFALWFKRKQRSTPTKQVVEMATISHIDMFPRKASYKASKYSVAAYDGDLDYCVEGLSEPALAQEKDANTKVQSEMKIEELVVEVEQNQEGFQESEATPSFVRQCCLMRLLPFYIIVILLSEVALIFVNPFDSIFPIGIASHEIVVPLEGEFVMSKHCPNCPENCEHMGEMVSEAREFYKHSLIDFSIVRIAFGGLPGHFNDAGAMAFDRAVYLPFDDCPSSSLFVHEFAHIWQMQSGWWFDNGVSKFIRYEKEARECEYCLYDYGGEEGLRKAAEDPKATITSAFWVEQQASIVEDYYICLYEARPGCSSEEQQLLMRFSADILYHNSKKSCEVEDLILTWVESEDCPSEILSGSEGLSEHITKFYHYYGESANEIESRYLDGVYGDRLQFSGCSSVYLSMQLKEGISSGYCECDNDDDMCDLPFIDDENQESSNCGIYDIYQWSCPSETNHN